MQAAAINRTIHAADLFCGAGGTSTGLYRACLSMGRRVDLLAVNHWKVAIETHTINHPGARHICARLDAIRPEDAIPSGHLNILVASPECTHHSVARGGRPVCDQLRASAWTVLRWIETLRVDNVLIENVQEFRNWGPLGANLRPLKRRQGETYQAFLGALRSFGYTVEDRVLNAADYGDATSRRRLFILARRGNKRISWPEPTHGEPDMFGDRQPYRTAREIIDWTIKGQSIYERKRPLAPNTMRRIMAGLRKFGGESFIVHLRGTTDSDLNSTAKPTSEPIPTLTAHDHLGLCEPFIVQYNGQSEAHSVDKPLNTITTNPHLYLAEPFLIHTNHAGGDRVHDVDNPLPTIATAGAISLVEPFIVKYFGTGGAQSVETPLDTITTKDRFGLVEVSGKYQVDIRFRMLQPHELAAAMSFDGYQFAGNRGDQVKQIGNAVPVRIAEALCTSLLNGVAA